MALLDTNVLIDLMKGSRSGRRQRVEQKLTELSGRGENFKISIFTVAELLVGVNKGTQPERERESVESCLEKFQVVPFERSTAEIFGRFVAALERQGLPISDMDALIGSVALEHGEPLVTRNPRHFARIPGLVVVGY